MGVSNRLSLLVLMRMLLFFLLIFIADCNGQSTPGPQLSSSQQDIYDNGFDNPYLKALSPSWHGPKYWWLTNVKKDNIQTVFSNTSAVNNNNNNNNHNYNNSLWQTNGENDQNVFDNVKDLTITDEEILAAYGNISTPLNSPSVGIYDGPFGGGDNDNDGSNTDNTPLNIVEMTTKSSLLDSLDQSPPPCDCVMFYICYDNGTIKTKGQGLLGDRSQIRKTPNDCQLGERYCCLPGTPVPDSTQIGQTVDDMTQCGRQAPNIFPGTFADRISTHLHDYTYPGEFPWMVAILLNKTLESTDLRLPNVYQCGGAIIDKRIIITSAHCVYNKITNRLYKPSEVKIRAGVWNISNDLESTSFQSRDVQFIISHEQFNIDSLVYDIALLVLTEPLEYTLRVGSICLPEGEENFNNPLECVVCGWGKDKMGPDAEMRPALKKVNLPLVDHKTCERKLQTTRLSRYFELDESFICAGGIVGFDTCSGDGGSPLVCRSSNTSSFRLTGLVSWGIDCATEIPGVYSNIGKNIQWILNTKTSILSKYEE